MGKKKYSKFCSVAGCDERHYSKGFCARHAKMKPRDIGDELIFTVDEDYPKCSVPGCKGNAVIGQLCVAHYERKLEIAKTLGGKCAVCGYNRTLEAMRFRSPTNVNKLVVDLTIDVKTLKARVKGTTMICVNCSVEEQAGILEINV